MLGAGVAIGADVEADIVAELEVAPVLGVSEVEPVPQPTASNTDAVVAAAATARLSFRRAAMRELLLDDRWTASPRHTKVPAF